jgi:hypothetical protein
MIVLEKCPNAAAAGGIRIGKNPNAQLIYVALLYTFLISDNPKLSLFYNVYEFFSNWRVPKECCIL